MSQPWWRQVVVAGRMEGKGTTMGFLPLRQGRGGELEASDFGEHDEMGVLLNVYGETF